MAATVAQLSVEVKANTEQAERGIKSVDDKVKGASGWKGILGNALSFAGAQVGITAVSDAFGLLTGQIGDMIQAGLHANEVQAQTDAALRSTHDASGMTAQGINGLATQLMNLTGIDDDVVQSGENILLTFTNIHKDTFPAATKATADLATAMHMDMSQAALVVGKALNDPIQGVTALRREGVQLSAQQADQVKHFMAVGDSASAQKIILGELSKEFGGSAEAAGKANNSQKILTAQINNAKQEIGQTMDKALLPLAQAALPKVRDALNTVNGIMQNATKFAREHKDIVGILAAIVGGIVVAAFTAWAISVIAATWPILAIGAGIALLIVGLKAAYDHVGWFHAAVDGIKPALNNMGDLIHKIIDFVGQLIGKIGDFLGKLGHVKDAIADAFSHLPNLNNLHLPGFASGGEMDQTGLAMVGENGPELIALPGGSHIFNANETRNLMRPAASATGFSGSGGGNGSGYQGPQVLQIHIAGHRVADALLPDLVSTIRLHTGRREA